MRADRLDPAPLVAASRLGVRGLARALGIDPAVLCRSISYVQADRYAVAIGKHPFDVWGQAWIDCEAAYEADDPPTVAEVSELVDELIEFGHRAAADGREDAAQDWYERATFVEFDADAEGINITAVPARRRG